MEESNRIKIEEVKSNNVEVIKDTNNEPEIVNDLAEQKKNEREERKCLIQLIIVFVVWVTLIIILMRTEKRSTPHPAKSKAAATHRKAHSHHKKYKTYIKKHKIHLAYIQTPPPNMQKNLPQQNNVNPGHKKLYL